MGSPEKPIDLEMGDMDEETQKLNPSPEVKVEDGTGKTEREPERFTGLKKEELIRISEQRKWVVARWILFILFWVLWIAMLVGAIIIVIKAPRCKPEPKPEWYQDTVVYQADVRKFAKSFSGMKEHLGYISGLNAKTVVVCHASNLENPLKIVNDDKNGFKNLSDEIKKQEMKVVVDLQIDGISERSEEFVNSATKSCADGATEKNCQLFIWKTNGTELEDTYWTDRGSWKYHPEREENYFVFSSDATNPLVALNYASEDAKAYLKTLLTTWLANGVDGFQLRDLNNVKNAVEVVDYIRETLPEIQPPNVKEEDEKKVHGLFLVSSSKDAETVEALYGTMNNETAEPVVINSELAEPLPDSGTGKALEQIISSWRDSTYPHIGAYAVNTMSLSPLATRLSPNRTAGLTLLSLALPGVPIIKSGDETLLKSDDFIWEKDVKAPQNASESNIKIVSDMVAMRASQFRSMQSLRWDNEDATMKFRETDSDDVIAFTRRWDIKPMVLVISNLSANNVTVKMTHSEEEKSASVLMSSDPDIKEKEKYEFDKIELRSGLTLVLQMELEES